MEPISSSPWSSTSSSSRKNITPEATKVIATAEVTPRSSLVFSPFLTSSIDPKSDLFSSFKPIESLSPTNIIGTKKKHSKKVKLKNSNEKSLSVKNIREAYCDRSNSSDSIDLDIIGVVNFDEEGIIRRSDDKMSRSDNSGDNRPENPMALDLLGLYDVEDDDVDNDNRSSKDIEEVSRVIENCKKRNRNDDEVTHISTTMKTVKIN